MAVLQGLFHPADGITLYIDSFQAVYLINGRVLADTADLNALTHRTVPSFRSCPPLPPCTGRCHPRILVTHGMLPATAAMTGSSKSSDGILARISATMPFSG